MDSKESILSTIDSVVYHTKCHWAILLGPVFVIVIGWLAFPSQGYHAIALIAFGFLWGFFAYKSLYRSEIVLTNDRLIINAGFPILIAHNIPLNSIVAIDFYQPSLGSMLNFGKIMIVHKEKKRLIIRFVCDPADLVYSVRQQIATLQQPSTDK
jgi:hypothetical protein